MKSIIIFQKEITCLKRMVSIGKLKQMNELQFSGTINMFASFFIALLNLLVGFIGSLNIFYVFILVGATIILFTIFTRAKSEYL